MSKGPTGTTVRRDGKWWARVRYVGADGQHHEKRRLATTKRKAQEMVRKLLNDAEETDGQSFDNENKTFDQLADLYESKYLVPIRYDGDGNKVRGMRGTIGPGGKVIKGSLYTAKLQLRMLRAHFSGTRLRSITYHTIEQFQFKRHDTPTKEKRCKACRGPRKRSRKEELQAPVKCATCGGKGVVAEPRSWATVNREMTMLNRMLNIAKQAGWIIRNPFTAGESLVKLSKEKKRKDVQLTREEEARLLATCDLSTLEGRRLHATLVCALDTGMRQAEIFGLEWNDVDLDGFVIRVRKINTKTLEGRSVPMSGRVHDELVAWRQVAPAAGRGQPLFGYTANVKRNFSRARATAGLDHFRWHDARHVAASRLAKGGMPMAEVGRILGHKSLSALTYLYTGTDDTTLRRAALVIDAGNIEAAKQRQPAAADDAQAVN